MVAWQNHLSSSPAEHALPTTLLHEYDRNEWFDIVRRVRPDLKEAEFDRLWAEFCRMKEQRTKS